MNIFLNLDGTAQIIGPVPIFQGSNAVTKIEVQSFFPKTTAMELYFIMPDADRTKSGPFTMQPVTPQSGTGNLNYWSWTLIKSITELAGEVEIIINAISGAPGDDISGIQNTTSFSCAFPVTPGVLPSPPTYPPSQDQWALILQYMQAAFVTADTAYMAVNPIQIKTQSETLPSGGAAYVNLQLIYDGIIIKEWSSQTQSWRQINPEPDPETADPKKWVYNFIIGIPRSDIPGPPGASVAAGAQPIIFYASDWQGTSPPYTFEILPSDHKLGETRHIGAFLFEINGSSNSVSGLYDNYNVSEGGVVTLYSNTRFDGSALLVAGVVTNGATASGNLQLSNPATESISGTAAQQSDANEEFVTAIKQIEQGGKYVETSVIPTSTYTILFTTHLKENPIVTILDNTTGEELSQNYSIDTNNNVTIYTNTEFEAKIIIQ